jgi:hypothetical protein
LPGRLSFGDWGIYAAGSQNFIMRNEAAGNDTHFFAGAGNIVGPVVTGANIATSQNPHANYSP